MPTFWEAILLLTIKRRDFVEIFSKSAKYGLDPVPDLDRVPDLDPEPERTYFSKVGTAINRYGSTTLKFIER